jgi:hypothetical protein
MKRTGVIMVDLKYERLVDIQGRMEADVLESFLEAHGIDVELIQESVGQSVYPVTIDGLGRVQVFVPKEKIMEAREFLKEFQSNPPENSI